MSNYRIKQKVDWKRVMKIQRWFLTMRMRSYEDIHLLRYVSVSPVACAKKSLREDLELYISLRKFLGNDSPAKIEAEVEAMLETVPEHPTN